MALDILNDNWGPYTHTEVENALKAYLAVLEGRINQAIQEGGVGLTDLSLEVQALLTKANTALQPGDIASWAKAQNKPGYTVSEITGVEGFQNLLAKLQDMDQKIQAAAQSGVTVDPQLADSGNPVANRAVKAAIDALTNTLNTLIGSGNVQGAINTFNEVVAFLNGINSSDTLAAKLALKANDADVVKSVSVNGQTPAATPDQNGNVNIEVQGGAQGPKGDTGNVQVDGNGNVLIVNSLDEGGTGAAFSAEMGKRVAGREATDRQRIDAIVAILKKSVFTDDQSAAIAALDALANATDSVSLDKSNYLFNGISGTLTLTVSTDPAGKSVNWSSSNPSVATVNNGVVTPIAEGSTIISATTTDGKSATCTVTVQAFVVDSVTIDQSDATYNGEIQGTTHQLTATTSPAGGAVLWSSRNTSVATINETTGLLAIVGNGQTTITAADATRTKTDTITVTVSNIVAPSITLNQNTITSNGEDVGDTHQLTATVVPNTDTVEWSSSESSVATVDNTGLVTIVGNGDCTITATSSRGLSATCAVSVRNIVTQYIDFEGDTLAKQIVLANYPHSNPNEITKQEAAAVTEMRLDPQGTGTLTSPFANTAITNANWLKWFTGIAPSSHSMPRLFANCASLMSVCVPEGITTVSGQCLMTNGGSGGVGSSLEVIDLPSTLTNITIHAIYPNENTVILLRSSNCTLAYSGIESGYKIKAIYVPDDKVSYYKGASQWSGYASKIFGLSEYDPSN